MDWALDPSHDLSNPQRQESIREQLQDAVFAAAALDCSTKSRAREIPPEGIPDLPMADQLRISKDNLACSFVLTELQALADRGGGSVRENPLRSLHWELTQEKQMMATGLWQDTVYSACCFMGARCKAQRLRHNIDEIASWPDLQCHHTHAADEWQPYLQDGQRVFPSREDAEYTASLAFGIAVSASWWAARMGLAKLHVPRFPFVETTGRREHWLHIDPRALREWAMAPTAVCLGLRPTHPHERAKTPQRKRVVDVIREDKTLPPGVVYVGRGHHSHRLPVIKWSSPFVPGHNCDPSSWLPLYVEHIMQRLAGDLPELTGCVLACDCEMDIVCEGDGLAGLVFEFGRVRQVLAAVAGLPPTVGAVILYWSQEAVVAAFCSLYPPHYFKNFCFLMVEDLHLLYAMAAQSGTPLGRAAGPNAGLSPAQRLLARAAEGEQCPPLLPFGLSCEQHFEHSLARADEPLPTEQPPLMGLDLQFAAESMASNYGSMRELRQGAVRALRELKSRWARVSTRLRHLQPDAIRTATQHRDLGLLTPGSGAGTALWDLPAATGPAHHTGARLL